VTKSNREREREKEREAARVIHENEKQKQASTWQIDEADFYAGNRRANSVEGEVFRRHDAAHAAGLCAHSINEGHSQPE
jgi:hypothetical protein